MKPTPITHIPPRLRPGIAARIRKYARWSPDGCLIWVSRMDSGGYGSIRIRIIKGVTRELGAHRAAYLALKGDIPDGYQIDHLCSVRACVNINHLEAVTPRENIARSMRRGGRSGFRQCSRGHERTEENTYSYRDRYGYLIRECRTCTRESKRRWEIINRPPGTRAKKHS